MLTPCVLTTLASKTPNDDAVEPSPGNTPLLFAAVVGTAPRPVAKLVLFVLPAQLTPRSRPALRSTSRMRTFSMTCCEAGNLHCIDDWRIRREALCDVDGACGRQTVARLATQHNLAVGARNADVSASGAGGDLVLQRRRVGRHIEVDHRHQMPLLIEYGMLVAPIFLPWT